MTNTERIDLRGDGRVIIWARGKKGIYQARIKVPGATGFILRTTNTSKLHEATAAAITLYDELYHHVKQGGTLQTSPSYRAVWKEWSKYEQREKLANDVHRYSVPFFDKEPIDKITAARMTDFWLHRQSAYKTRKPSSGTLKRELTSMRALFRYAKAKGYISEIPDLNPLKVSPSGARRGTFTAKEWQTILDAMDSWVNEDGIATSNDRAIAVEYFRILANTGIRIGEARGLKWANVRRDGAYTIFEVTGKTGTREVVCLPGTDAALDRLRARTAGHDLVFSHPDGRPIGSFKTSWSSLLRAAGIPKRGRTIYSLRHYFATQRLMNGLNQYLLAKQMGTSVDMIEKHYGHVVHSEVAEQIVRDQIRQGLGADLNAFIDE